MQQRPEIQFRASFPTRALALTAEAAAPGAILAGASVWTDSTVSFSRSRRKSVVFLSASLLVKGDEGFSRESGVLEQNGEKFLEGTVLEGKEECVEEAVVEKEKPKVRGRGARASAVNTTKHLWAGVVAAMVSRTFVAPLERLKLEYIVRGEQRNLFELINHIAVTQGLKGFWKGNFVNILRTAPFKSINFYAYDTYRKQLLKLSGNKEATNIETFLAGAAAGITATMLCIPMDTIRTKMVAPGGEALGGVIGVFRHMVQTEGFFSLYKGLVPSVISMAPSGAVFYGVYDILKSAYLHSPEGRNRIFQMNKQEGNALDHLELGPMRTLLYGAIAGACAEATTYPFEVVRRQLQMQVQATRLNAFATCAKIVEHGGVPALYAGLIPSLLQYLTPEQPPQEGVGTSDVFVSSMSNYFRSICCETQEGTPVAMFLVVSSGAHLRIYAQNDPACSRWAPLDTFKACSRWGPLGTLEILSMIVTQNPFKNSTL